MASKHRQTFTKAILHLLLVVILIYHKVLAHTSDNDGQQCPNQGSFHRTAWELVKVDIDAHPLKIPDKNEIILRLMEEDGPSNLSFVIKDGKEKLLESFINILHWHDNCKAEVAMDPASIKHILSQRLRNFQRVITKYIDKVKVMRTYKQNSHQMLVMRVHNVRFRFKSIPTFPTFEGKWKLISANKNRKNVKFPDDVIIDLKSNKSDKSSFSWNLKATNKFWTNIKVKGVSNGFDTIEVGPGIARTRMLAQKEHEEIEHFFQNVLENIEKIKEYETDGQGRLKMMSKDADMTFERLM